MKEINEKDLEKTSGGKREIHDGSLHDQFSRCDKFEKASGPKGDFMIDCCLNCAHSRAYGGSSADCICDLD